MRGRPRSSSDRAKWDADKLLLYGWKMLVRRDDGGQDPIDSLLSKMDERYPYRIIHRHPDDRNKIIDKYLKFAEGRINRVIRGIKERQSHSKKEIIDRIDACDKFMSRPTITAEELFKNYNKIEIIWPDDSKENFRKFITSVIDKIIEEGSWDSTGALMSQLADKIYSLEESAKNAFRDYSDDVADAARPILEEFDRLRPQLA